MNITKYIERAIYFVPRNYINVNFYEFFSRGEISVSTPFQYTFSQKDRYFEFRTIIQLDADIINFIPNPDLVENDNDWCKLYKEKYQAHLKEVQHNLAKLENITRTFTWTISGAFSVIVLYILYKDVNVTESTVYAIGFLMIILTYIFKRFIIGRLLRGFLLKM